MTLLLSDEIEQLSITDLFGPGSIVVTPQDADEILTPVVERFVVDTFDKANWAAGKIMAAREHLARVKENCAAIIKDAERDVTECEARFLPELEAYAHGALEGKKVKTLKMPEGAMSFRTVPQRVTLDDRNAALQYAKAHLPDAVKVAESVDATKLLDTLAVTNGGCVVDASTGEQITFAVVVPARESFSLK